MHGRHIIVNTQLCTLMRPRSHERRWLAVGTTQVAATSAEDTVTGFQSQPANRSFACQKPRALECGGAIPNSPAGHAMYMYMISKPRTAAHRDHFVPAACPEEQHHQQYIAAAAAACY